MEKKIDVVFVDKSKIAYVIVTEEERRDYNTDEIHKEFTVDVNTGDKYSNSEEFKTRKEADAYAKNFY